MAIWQRLAALTLGFRFRLLIIFTIITAVVSASFTAFFISHEIRGYRSQLDREGALLADLLVHNARLALFAENRGALSALAEGAIRHPAVWSVEVTNREGVHLAEVKKGTSPAGRHLLVKSAEVTAGSSSLTPEAVLLGKSPGAGGEIIGRVRLVLDSSGIDEHIREVVAISVAICLLFWLLVSAGGFLVLNRVTNSFNRLMEGVKVIEGGDLSVRIPADSTDEPGRAAMAINAMAESLECREAKNRRLQAQLIEAVKLEVQSEKRQMMARLIQTNKMTSLGLLLSSMAHEINNPIASIRFNAHIMAEAWRDATPLLDGVYREEGDFYLGGMPYAKAREVMVENSAKIVKSSERIAQVVQDLRNYGLGGKSGFSPDVQPNRVVQGAIAIFQSHARHNIQLRTDLASDLPVINGNQQQLEQVVINLLMNAMQALPDGKGEIVLTTSLDSETGTVVIEVRDEGEGIPPEVMSRLCEPFFSTRLDRGGSGLGLYISRYIVTEHRGKLEFHSRPGQGTTARLRLPLLDPK